MKSLRMRSWLLSAAMCMGHFPVSGWAVWWHHWRYGWTPTGSSACIPLSNSQSARSRWPNEAAMYSATCSWNLESRTRQSHFFKCRILRLKFYSWREYLTSSLLSSLIGGSGLCVCGPGGNPGGIPPTRPTCPNGEWCLCLKKNTRKRLVFQNKWVPFWHQICLCMALDEAKTKNLVDMQNHNYWKVVCLF